MTLYLTRFASAVRRDALKRSRSVRTMMPGRSSDPIIVYVLPAPVHPYAKTVAL